MYSYSIYIYIFILNSYIAEHINIKLNLDLIKEIIQPKNRKSWGKLSRHVHIEPPQAKEVYPYAQI